MRLLFQENHFHKIPLTCNVSSMFIQAPGRENPRASHLKLSKGLGEEMHMNMHKAGNGGNIQVMGAAQWVVIRQVAVLGFSDHCVF